MANGPIIFTYDDESEASRSSLQYRCIVVKLKRRKRRFCGYIQRGQIPDIERVPAIGRMPFFCVFPSNSFFSPFFCVEAPVGTRGAAAIANAMLR